MNSNGELVADPSADFVADRIRATARAIRQTGARVLVVAPTPGNGSDLGQCLARTAYYEANEASCDFALDLETEAFDVVKSVSDTVPVYWLHRDFCPGGICDVMQENTLIYRDFEHLSNEGSAYLGRKHDWVEHFRKTAN